MSKAEHLLLVGVGPAGEEHQPAAGLGVLKDQGEDLPRPAGQIDPPARVPLVGQPLIQRGHALAHELFLESRPVKEHKVPIVVGQVCHAVGLPSGEGVAGRQFPVPAGLVLIAQLFP